LCTLPWTRSKMFLGWSNGMSLDCEGNQEILKIGFFRCPIRQMVAQGKILVLGKTLDFLTWLSIFNVLSTFYLFLQPLVFVAWSWSMWTMDYNTTIC
jgi:hypothetical protein